MNFINVLYISRSIKEPGMDIIQQIEDYDNDNNMKHDAIATKRMT